jgi:acetyl esterase
MQTPVRALSEVPSPSTATPVPSAASEGVSEEVEEVRSVDANGVPCMLYRPKSSRTDVGHVVYLHGGGFALFEVQGHDRAARRLANRSGLPVLSIDYRLAPQYRFPAQLDDIAAVLDWLATHGERAGLRGRTFLEGDSAGGNLALVTALRNPGCFSALVLIYPFLDPEASFESYRTAVPGQVAADATVFWHKYVASEADLVNPDVAPLRSTALHTLPPTLIAIAEIDMLRDEGEHLVKLLIAAGVDVVAARWLGWQHERWREPVVSSTTELVTRHVAAFLELHC